MILSLAALVGLAAGSGAFSAPTRETHVTRAYLAKAIEQEVIAGRPASPPQTVLIPAPAFAPPRDDEPGHVASVDLDLAPHDGEALGAWLAPAVDTR